jgi:uncharacterized membrane protein YhaH (DUF805 family)
MKKQNNIYNYSAPKSGNEETSFFLTQGRITTITFYKRLGFTIGIYILSYFIFGLNWNDILYGFVATIHLYIIPYLLPLFVCIQGAKRMHDINKSGWYFLIPIYNIYLTFLKGTIGSNDYGVDPKPMPKVTYFDELEQNEVNIEPIKKTKKNLNARFIIIASFVSLIILYLLISNNNSNQNIQKIDTLVVDTPIKAKPIKKKSKVRKRKKEKFNHNISLDSLNKLLKLLQEVEVNGETTPDTILNNN